ncbi:TraB/GumN family protein [Ralstonia sp. R-29]|uniref:TraB/GumN family protein n=1 Tax=Ralstonia sp. R-29 TaxID=3404059 RepID=UPI003CF7D5EA
MARNRTTWRALAAALGLLVGIGTATAQDTPPPTSTPDNCPPPATSFVPKDGWAAAAQRATDHGLLWRIEKDGHTSWLYGTIHVARADWMLPGPTLRDALKHSDAIALELDLLDKGDSRKALEAGTTNDERRLLTGRRGQRFNKLLATSCLPEPVLTQIRKFQPTLQLASLAVLGVRTDGLYPDFGIDLFLTTYAKGAKVPIVPLETLSEQMRVLNEIVPKNEMAQQFDTVLDAIESGEARTETLTLANAWAESDLDTLEHYPQWCDCLKTPSDKRAFQRLVTNRNRAMAENIARVHDSGQRVFGAVGALHMIGPKGIPALLAARGFTVTPVLPPASGR